MTISIYLKLTATEEDSIKISDDLEYAISSSKLEDYFTKKSGERTKKSPGIYFEINLTKEIKENQIVKPYFDIFINEGNTGKGIKRIYGEIGENGELLHNFDTENSYQEIVQVIKVLKKYVKKTK